MCELQENYACNHGGGKFFLRLVLPDGFEFVSGTKRNMGVDYWLREVPSLMAGMFQYEDGYNFTFETQLELFMITFNQPYSEILLIPTEERLKLVKKYDDLARKQTGTM